MANEQGKLRRIAGWRKIATVRIGVVLACVAVAGCGLATYTARPEPPPHLRAINPDAEWSEVKASRAAGRTGTLVLEVRPTLERSVLWGDQHLESVTVRIVPYASGLWEELSALLVWRYQAGLYSPAKARDAPPLISEALARYRTALRTVALADTAHDLTLGPDRRASIVVATGEYLVFSEADCCSAPIHKVWVWLLRARLEPDATTTVLLDDANRLCFEASTPNGTSCRDR